MQVFCSASDITKFNSSLDMRSFLFQKKRNRKGKAIWDAFKSNRRHECFLYFIMVLFPTSGTHTTELFFYDRKTAVLIHSQKFPPSPSLFYLFIPQGQMRSYFLFQIILNLQFVFICPLICKTLFKFFLPLLFLLLFSTENISRTIGFGSIVLVYFLIL